MVSVSPDKRGRRAAVVVLAAYTAVLAILTLWPAPVTGPLLRLARKVGPVFAVVTSARLEFLANIALFVPLGVLLAVVLPAALRYLVMPAGFLASVFVEGVQALALPARTPSVIDVVANTAGACLGVIVAEVLDAQRRQNTRTSA